MADDDLHYMKGQQHQRLHHVVRCTIPPPDLWVKRTNMVALCGAVVEIRRLFVVSPLAGNVECRACSSLAKDLGI